MRVRTHTNPFTVRTRFDKDLIQSFNQALPIDVEIGFGRGVFLRHCARLHPERILVGIDVRKAIVDILQDHLSLEPLPNVTLLHGNAHYFLEDCLDVIHINRVFIFHPDPWFKQRHHKRRVINNRFILQLSKVMARHGRVYVSTDVASLFDDINHCFSQFKEFKAVDDAFWEKEYKTHWDAFSKEGDRSRFSQAFELI